MADLCYSSNIGLVIRADSAAAEPAELAEPAVLAVLAESAYAALCGFSEATFTNPDALRSLLTAMNADTEIRTPHV